MQPRKPGAGTGAGKKRAHPSSSLMGGGDLLDSILGGVSKTATKMAARPINTNRGGQEELEIDSHFAMYRPPKEQANGMPIDRFACRNPDCGGRQFDTDWRQGDRICTRCGTVQNNRSVESHEEEHRTFAEDKEKGTTKERTSQVKGNGPGVVESGLQRAQNIAAGMADNGDGMTEKAKKRIEDYRQKVSDLAGRLEVQGQIVRDGHELCETLVYEQISHDKECGRKGGSCRLALKQAKASFVAAALLKEAMRKHGTDRQFDELKAALRDDGVEAHDANKIGKFYNIVVDLLKGTPYTCMEPTLDEEGAAEEGGASGAAASAGEGGGVSTTGGMARGMSPVNGGAAGGGGGDGRPGAPNPAAAIIPRYCDQLSLPYFLQLRATEIIEDWQRAGMPASYPATIASVALLRAYDELVTPALKRKADAQVPDVTVASVALASGIQEFTITKQMKHPELPWPTSLLNDAVTRLTNEGKITARFAEGAKQRLANWLATPQGAGRTWCRQTKPWVLAACALLAESKHVATQAGDSSLIVKADKDSLSPLAAATAVHASASDAAPVDAAMAACPAPSS